MIIYNDNDINNNKNNINKLKTMLLMMIKKKGKQNDLTNLVVWN